MACKGTDVSDKSTSVKKKYVDDLEPVVKARYFEKIKLVGDVDPYDVKKSDWSSDISTWAEITYHNIVNYLVINQSAYTWQDFEAVKSLSAYNQFVCGWVKDIGCIQQNGLCLMSCRVKHSQRMNDPSTRPWLIAEKTGRVLAAHCDCMAGLGEACTHVGTFLFAVEAAVKIHTSRTVTQEKAYWLLPSSVDKVPYSEVRDIDFTSAKTKKKKLDDRISTTNESDSTPGTPSGSSKPSIPPPTTAELSACFEKLWSSDLKPAALALDSEYADYYIPVPLTDNFPQIMSELRDEQCYTMAKDELFEHCDAIYDKLEITEQQISRVEDLTRDQATNKLWGQVRTGRITASVMKRSCRTSLVNPASTLIQDICYPTKRSHTNLTWGKEHERVAREKYLTTQFDSHDSFLYVASGLWLSKEYPFIGASPDGLVRCLCCGDGCLEIKCPISKKDMTVEEAAKTDPNFYLKFQDGELRLDSSHEYYYQVQTQLFICKMEYCDFVVWTEVDCQIVRVEPDVKFWTKNSKLAETFFRQVILPEMVGRLYTRSERSFGKKTLAEISPNKQLDSPSKRSKGSTEEALICICQVPYDEEDGDVIACDDENCKYKWLHFKCIGLKRAPSGTWLCKECRRKRKSLKVKKKLG